MVRGHLLPRRAQVTSVLLFYFYDISTVSRQHVNIRNTRVLCD